jgi:tRNA-2-methylthio-N6-dimethylallyladenosine synthase
LRDKVYEIWHPDEYFEASAGGPIYSSKTSAYVPIMTGCNNFCTYCAVPYTRGREKSRPTKQIVKEVKNLLAKGCKEIWLLGQNVNSYKGAGNFPFRASIYKYINDPTTSPIKGKLPAPFVGFPQLLKMINDLSGNFQIQFLTSHPKDMSDELIKTIAECEKVSREIHLPLQSGDDAILRKMNRRYTLAQYKKLVKKIRKYIPEAKISTDIIVGFPGETKKQFENTTKAIRELKFSKAYIACYSPRPATAAAKMKDNVPRQEKKERRRTLEKIVIGK